MKIDNFVKPNERKPSVTFVKKTDLTLYGAPAAVITGFILITGHLPEQQVMTLVTNHVIAKTSANMIVFALVPKVVLMIDTTEKIGIVNLLLVIARIRIIMPTTVNNFVLVPIPQVVI